MVVRTNMPVLLPAINLAILPQRTLQYELPNFTYLLYVLISWIGQFLLDLLDKVGARFYPDPQYRQETPE